MATKTDNKYYEAVGRRKTSVARVRITPGAKNTWVVNDKDLATYFPTKELQAVAGEVSEKTGQKFAVSAKISGGGVHSQAEALRLGIARALVKVDEALRKPIKAEGMLKRDPRAKERRKFGLKKARKSPQWSKR